MSLKVLCITNLMCLKLLVNYLHFLLLVFSAELSIYCLQLNTANQIIHHIFITWVSISYTKELAHFQHKKGQALSSRKDLL